MGKHYKHIENLWSWHDFAKSGSIPNFDVMDSIKQEIDDYKAKYGLR